MASVVGSISFTITMSSMFLGFREAVSKRNKFLEKMLHCPWCLGHWVAFIAILVLGNFSLIIVSPYWLLNFLYTSFAVIGFSGLFHYVLLIAYDPAKKAEKLREIEKRKAEKSKT